MSAICPNYEMSDYGGYEYDPQVDFAQFLEEARQAQRVRSTDTRSYIPKPEEAEKRKTGQEKKVKKSWKKSLLNWWKAERRGKTSSETTHGYSSGLVSQRKGHVSGPINGGDRGAYTRRGGSASGPLANLFSSTKNKGNETPYMSLNRVNSCPGVNKAYGPVYLVT